MSFLAAQSMEGGRAREYEEEKRTQSLLRAAAETSLPMLETRTMLLCTALTVGPVLLVKDTLKWIISSLFTARCCRHRAASFALHAPSTTHESCVLTPSCRASGLSVTHE